MGFTPNKPAFLGKGAVRTALSDGGLYAVGGSPVNPVIETNWVDEANAQKRSFPLYAPDVTIPDEKKGGRPRRAPESD